MKEIMVFLEKGAVVLQFLNGGTVPPVPEGPFKWVLAFTIASVCLFSAGIGGLLSLGFTRKVKIISVVACAAVLAVGLAGIGADVGGWHEPPASQPASVRDACAPYLGVSHDKGEYIACVHGFFDSHPQPAPVKITRPESLLEVVRDHPELGDPEGLCVQRESTGGHAGGVFNPTETESLLEGDTVEVC